MPPHLKAQINNSLRAKIAPKGTLRVSINVGNPILAKDEGDAKLPTGVSVDIAQALATLLDLPLSLNVHKAAAHSVSAVTRNESDFGFFAIDPKRGELLEFTDPYLLIEGAYLVRESSPIKTQDQVDQQGVNIMVGAGSAYDLYLSRTIKHAQLQRAPTSPAVVEHFLQQNAEVAAGVRQQLELSMEGLPGLRLLPGSFMVIRQAVGVAKTRPAEVHTLFHQFVRHICDSGFVAQALKRHKVEGGRVAAAGD